VLINIYKERYTVLSDKKVHVVKTKHELDNDERTN